MAYDPTVFYLGTLGSEQPISANEAEMSHTIENIRRDTRLLSGNLVVAKTKQIGHWQWRYSSLPGQRRDVYDGGMSRNDLFALYQADTTMSYLAPNDNALHTAYTVRFAKDSWRNRIAQRAGDSWRWDLTFELVQVS